MKTISFLDKEICTIKSELHFKIVPISSALVNRFDEEAMEQKKQFENFATSIGDLFHKLV